MALIGKVILVQRQVPQFQGMVPPLHICKKSQKLAMKFGNLENILEIDHEF
jgi:hypothetical protein